MTMMEVKMKYQFTTLTFCSVILAAGIAQAAGKDGVAAIVNGEQITVAEIKESYDSNPAIKNQVTFDDFYKKALDVYVNSRIIYQQAVKDGITSTPEYNKQLNLAKEDIARKIYLEKKVQNKVTEDEIKKVYEEYKKNFSGQKEMKAKHILVDNEAKAKEVIDKLNKGGDFDKLAKLYTKEPTELGYFTKQMMVPEFADAAFAMSKGEHSKKPVKTQFGYHVILVEDVRDAKVLPMKQVEPQLKGMLTQNAVAEIIAKSEEGQDVIKYNLDGTTK